MGWKKVPGAQGWEVSEKETPEGRRLFKYTEDENRAGQRWTSLWNLRSRLNNFFDLDIRDNDPRIQMENGRLKIRVPVKERDFKLFCTPIDEVTFKAMKNHWEHDKWQNIEEHKLMEKCLDELYQLEELTLGTNAELAEYEGFLELRYPELMKQPRGRLDLFIVFAHKKFVNFGLNAKVPLGEEEIKSVQAMLELEPTGRYGLATAKAVKALQRELRTKGLYDDGPIDGIWNSKLEVAWQLHKEAQGNYGIMLEDLGIKIDPDRTILSAAALKRLEEIATVLVGFREYQWHSKHNHGDRIIRVGKTKRNGEWETVYLVLGDKFTEEVAWAIRIAAMLLQEEKEKTTTAKEIAKELERRGLTQENLEQMARDIEWAIDIGSCFTFVGGGIKKGSIAAAKKIARELKGKLRKKIVKKGAKKYAKKRVKRKIVGKATKKVIKSQIHGHHPLAKYLGGRLKQRLTKLPRNLHIEYHRALGNRLGVWNREQAQKLIRRLKKRGVAKKMIEITREFDKKYGTNILKDLLFELKAHKWIR